VTTCRVLLPHPLEPRLLMTRVRGEWRLPEWTDGTTYSWHETAHVNRAVASRFGMETTVLRCVLERVDPVTRSCTRVYDLDNRSAPHDAVPGTTWIGAAELPMLWLVDAETRELAEDWFSRDRGDLPLRGMPWMQRGWYVEALAWSARELDRIAITVDGPPEQLRAGERSFVMRVRTDAGAFFFKAAPPSLGHEPELADWLATRYPTNFAQVIAVDASRGWLLAREVAAGGLPLEQVREEEEWYRAVRRLAEIQLDCVKHARALTRLGCPYRGLEMLARRIPRLCADVDAMTPAAAQHAEALTPRDVARITSLGPTLLTLCEELASYDVPDSLEHGDLRAGSIISTLDGPVFVDWAHSSVSHPFFSMSPLMTQAAGLVPVSSRQSRRRLRDSYLGPWAEFDAPVRLTRAFEIARVLAPVHLAATVHAELLPGAGYRWELEPLIPGCLRSALKLLVDEDSPLLEA
jgi:hypothetical protein